MTIEAKILTNIAKLPDSVKQAVFLYTEFLVSQYAEVLPDKTEEELEKQCFAGSMKGTFVLPLADDFDEPLEDFKEY